MPCLALLIVLAFPRLAIVLLYMFSNFFRGVYDSLLIPLLGFIFLPLTLLAYTWLVKIHQPFDLFFFVVMGIAVIVDLGLVGGGHYSRRKG
jgi:hypothetical protein